MTEPRWRRYADETPDDGAQIAYMEPGMAVPVVDTYEGAGGWSDDDLWMPESEWRDVLARIPEPAEKGEHVVITFEDDDGYYVTQWPQFAETSKAIRCSYKQDAETIAAALNAYEGRTR